MAARRAPAPPDRQRDAERSRALILDAALQEFAERGFAGARTGAIARRAGVNPQLISYYFDGKAGLYRALTRRGAGEMALVDDPDAPLADVVAGFVRHNAAHQAWARLLIWEALAPGTDPADTDHSFLHEKVEGIRRRQERGELDPELDPATVLLVLFSAALAPIVLPDLTTVVTGAPPTGDAATEHYVTHLRAVVRRLGPR